MSKHSDIADAVVTALNSHSFLMSFTAERSYLPEFDLSDLAELKVTVLAPEAESSQLSRASRQFEYGIQIGVQKKVAEISNTEIDPLSTLVEQIDDYLASEAGRVLLRTGQAASWVRSQYVVVQDSKMLRASMVFTSVLQITYLVQR